MRIFHIATAADWESAQRSGAYATSTARRSLDEEGFIHAARRDQVADVFSRYYRGATAPLVLLTIDTDRLGVPWREDAVGEESYPHIYGPLSLRAVVGVQPLDARGGTAPLMTLFLTEVIREVLFAALVMGLTVIGAWGGDVLAPPGGALTGAAAGLLVGAAVALVLRRPGHQLRFRSAGRG